jgi:predicted Zn-dependent protease
MPFSRSDRTAAVLGLLGLLISLGCATLTIPQERQLGQQVQAQVRQEVDLLRDPVVDNYVSSIGRAIVRASGPQPFDYHFYVVAADEINAFALPAGFIYMNTETILRARNVSELAGVMAHEVGHVAKRHIAQNYNRQRSTGLLHQVAVLGAGMAGGSAAAGAANLMGGLAGMAYLNSFTREAEAEADDFAVDVMPQAGYDPRGMVTFFQTLKQEGGPSVPEFLSSHPTSASRIEATSARIARTPIPPSVRADDGGRLEIIQRRIRLLLGRSLDSQD